MIRILNLKKSFHKNVVLNGIDLTVNKGEVVAILGPSGSGKTTFLRCLNYLEHANSGQIKIGELEVDIQKITRKQIYELRRKTAMVFQQYHLFKHKTVLENVMEGLIVVQKMPKAKARERSIALLEKVGLGDKLDFYPHTLSGGQQQRVGIARALALNPDVILFDEPTSALDPELVGEVMAVIRQIAKEGITMIVVTHEISFAEDIANHVVFMDGGVIVEQGDPKQVIRYPKEERTKQFLSRLQPDGQYAI